MSDDLNYRMKQWSPPQRPEWVQRINEEGRGLDLKSVVPLSENSLIEMAKSNTGLNDFGDDDWYEPFKVLIKSYDEESNLSLMGRLMTRSDLLMHLEARLRIEEEYKRHPEIDEEEIIAPMLIIGSGRCGTSAMLNLLASDPDNAAPMHWEALFPVRPKNAAHDQRIAVADQRMTQWNRVTPEIVTMHEFAGDVPTELVQLEALSFQNIAWLYVYGFVPSYIGYMSQRTEVPALRYAKRILKLLQWKNPRRRWILKSPDAMRNLPEAFEVFPDLNLLWMHRDPLKAVSSMVSLIGTLFWIRSDQPLDERTFAQLTNPIGLVAMLNQAIDWIEQGRIPAKQICNIQYEDFVADPLASVDLLYRQFGIPSSEVGREALQTHLQQKPRDSRPVHKYSAGDVDRRAEERKIFERYQTFFNVSSEV